MRKELYNTKVTVRLRKSAYRNEWYLYIEVIQSTLRVNPSHNVSVSISTA
ncbi:hypothetical protein [Capnocytophaga cynodegmi]|nr:hypothetical protein [Capnocytophaga cynodegmi]